MLNRHWLKFQAFFHGTVARQSVDCDQFCDMKIFDGHLDLSMNAIDWNRDLTVSLDAINSRENGLVDKAGRGKATVCFEAMRSGGITHCIGTLIARYVKPGNSLPGWHSPSQAWSHIHAQLAWYREMERLNQLKLITNKEQLRHSVDKNFVQDQKRSPIAFILSLEGADSIVSMEHLERLHEAGLRAVGPAHYGPGTYAFGTNSEGSIGEDGVRLLKKMSELRMVLDLTHLCDTSFWEALNHFEGPIWASHSNCRKLVPDQRQFEDIQIKEIIDRKGIIGVAFDNWMLVPGWVKGVSDRKEVNASLDRLVDHIVHICHLAGNTVQVGIGSDLDGGFGRDQCPLEIESISDLGRLADTLSDRRFKDNEIQNIMFNNWYNYLLSIWSS